MSVKTTHTQATPASFWNNLYFILKTNKLHDSLIINPLNSSYKCNLGVWHWVRHAKLAKKYFNGASFPVFFLELSFNFLCISLISSLSSYSNEDPLGTYCRTRPFLFSSTPFFHEWQGRVKYTTIPIPLWPANFFPLSVVALCGRSLMGLSMSTGAPARGSGSFLPGSTSQQVIVARRSPWARLPYGFPNYGLPYQIVSTALPFHYRNCAPLPAG